MVGKYEIEIYDNRIHYQFEIKRNITIIQGDSATGKTALIRLIADYQRLGKGSGITLICDKKCIVLNSLNWESVIRSTHDRIFFIDEDQPFVRSGDFANAVKGSDNYFVIIYRDSLPRLAYSIDEIYGIREDKKYSGLKKTYNEVYKLYNLEEMKPISPLFQT